MEQFTFKNKYFILNQNNTAQEHDIIVHADNKEQALIVLNTMCGTPSFNSIRDLYV